MKDPIFYIDDFDNIPESEVMKKINIGIRNHYAKLQEEIDIVVKPKPRWMPKFIYNSVINSQVHIIKFK